MKKGQIVLAKAEVMTGYADDFSVSRFAGYECIHAPENSEKNKANSRNLYTLKYKTPVEVILLGKTTIQTGVRYDARQYMDEYDPPSFKSDMHHKVWAVCSYSPTDNRYTTPFYVLEVDLFETKDLVDEYFDLKAYAEGW